MSMSGDDIVISGMSGRFPLSDSVDELARNLFSGVDLITESDSRWPKDFCDISSRMGRIESYDRFDANFFGIATEVAEHLDPQSRMLLEVAYEAIMDAGMNPQLLSNSNTGVYIGNGKYILTDGYSDYPHDGHRTQCTNGANEILLNMQCFLSENISYYMNLKGPSIVVDTACSSSLSALNLAVNDLLLGKTDRAIVGGTHMLFNPIFSQYKQYIGMCSPRGVSAVLDESADGYVKSDAVCCLFIQRANDARRVYGRVVSARMGMDGYKTSGKLFPSSEAQEALMIEAYKCKNIDPLKLTYFEAHATGTKVGDIEEMKAIYRAYCEAPGRSQPLPIGCLKSSMGHSEGASGVAAIIKVLISYENESIPPNLNLKNLKQELKPYFPPLLPINETLLYKPGLAGINNFGIGGANAHVLVEPNYKLQTSDGLRIAETMPRIVNICGRNEGSVKHIMDFIENNPKKITNDFLALLTQTMKYWFTSAINSSGFPYRGSIIIKKISEENNEIQYNYKKQIAVMTEKSVRQLWLLFTGLGGQWTAMAKALMPIKIFADKVEECHQILQEFDIHLKDMLLSEDRAEMSTMTAKCCSTAALEIALFEVMTAINMTPDGIIGHSFGEIACAYADGCLSTRDAMIMAYMRGRGAESDTNIPNGLMAAVGLSESEALDICPKEVDIACNNGKQSVVVSGPMNEMKGFMKSLEEKSIFVRQIDSNGLPFHSRYMIACKQPMIDNIEEYVPKPKLRSKKWLSTAIRPNDIGNESLRYASAEYFAHNLVNKVRFYETLKQLPSNAVVLELGPHSLFKRIVTETLPNSTHISLMKKDSNHTNMDLFVSALAAIYELGFNLSIDRLYARVEWPVARNTQSISSLIKWDHSLQYDRKVYPKMYNRVNASDMNVWISPHVKEDAFYYDHRLDGDVLFPATGYLLLAHRMLAASVGKVWTKTAVVFEDIHFKRPVYLSQTMKTEITVKYNSKSDKFIILENSNECVAGRMRAPGDDSRVLSHQDYMKNIVQQFTEPMEYGLERDDIYVELKVLGYDYGKEFQGLRKIKTNHFHDIYGTNEWTGNLVTFLDALIQSTNLWAPTRQLRVPVMIKRMRLDPRELFKAITASELAMNGRKGMEETMPKLDVNYVSNNEIEDNLDDISVDIPFYYNEKCKHLVTFGVEIEGLVTHTRSRKSDSLELTLDSYEFCANDCMVAIDENHTKSLNEYLNVCKYMAMAIQTLGSIRMKCNFKCDPINGDIINKYRETSYKNHVMFGIFNEMFANQSQQKHNENIGKDMNQGTFHTHATNDMSIDIINDISLNERLLRTLVDIVCENVFINEITVTEINLSNALVAKHVVKYIMDFRIQALNANYHLIVKSLQQTDEEFRSFAVEWDVRHDMPLKSSYLVVLRDTQDLWQLDLAKHIRQLYASIESNGFLLTVFRYKFTDPEIALNSLNSKTHVNDSHLESRIEMFSAKCVEMGFRIISQKCDSIATKAILFRKIEGMPRIPTENQIINISGDYKQWFGVLQQKLIAAKDEDNPTDNIWLIASDSSLNGIIGLVNCLRFEPGGDRLRYIFNCDGTGSQTSVDFTVRPFSDILAKNLIANVINEGKVGTFRHLRLADTYDKTLSNEYYLNLGQTRGISGLEWYDSRRLSPFRDYYDINGNKSRKFKVNIYSSGILVRDIMLVEGLRPIDSSLTDCPIGLEFSGRRSDTGERVMGMDARNRCLSTSIYATEPYMTTIPEHWSMDDAVSILNAYMTLYYGLIERAQLQQGESVLIHSGAGGVGQAAINICQHFGCDIYVTVGTEDKVTFLKNECNIPENRIFHSRDIRFKNEIMKMSDGKGVDIVINSLSGEGLDATYECVCDNGRIVEIGKSDMYDNKSLGMYCFTRNVQLIAVVLDLLLVNDIQFMCRFYKWVQGNCTNGCIKPIKATVFKPEEVVKAFHSMTTGEHIGRLIIKFRDEETVRTPLLAMNRTMNMRTTVKTFFDPNKVYVITGGLGGFGLELIQWMHYRGGRKFVVTSRSGIRTDYQKFIINRLKDVYKSDKNLSLDVLVSTANGMTIEGTQQLLNKAKELGPIGGVFHLALALYNELFERQLFEDFCATVDIKHKIFAHLDQLSRQLAYKLDYFVVFSSVSCGKGNGGQSNYGFGNSLCERICDERRRDGLHGLAVQYGPIGDVGVIGGVDQGLGFTSMRKQRIHSCCDILDKLLAMNTPIVTSYIRVNKQTKEGTPQQNFIESIWRDMNIDPNVTPNDTTLADIGMESMFAVVLQQKLEKEYKMSLTVNLIKCLTVGVLKESENAKTDLVQSYLNSLRQSTDFLLKYNFHISNEKTIALNKCQTGKRLYILPPFVLNFTAWEEWALRANRPVIGLNWTPDVSRLPSLQEVTKYYVNLLKHLEPMDGKYEVIGHLDGAVICTQLVAKGMADIAVAIDVINDKHFYVDNKLNEDFMLKFVIKSLLKQIPDSYVNKIIKGLTEISDIKTKIAIIGKELVGLGGRRLVITDLTHVLEIMFARIECLLEYRLNATTMHSNDMKTQLVVIKPIEHNPTDDSEAEHHHQDQLADNYILSTIMGNMSNDANLRVERIICENPMDVTNEAIAEKITELLID